MNQEYLVEFEDAMQRLQSFGYAIVAFSPEELKGAEPSRVEDLLIEKGWDVIQSLSST